MPDFPEQGTDGPAEQPLPEDETRQHRQVIPQPQVAAAEGEAAPEPCEKQLGTDQELGQPGEAAVQGPQGIGGGTQQHPGEKAAGDPAEDQRGLHRRSPRRSRGSS